MNYKSTRGGVKGLKFSDAVMMGLAVDGGLLLPEEIPAIDMDELKSLSKLSFSELSFAIISKFVDDIEPDTLKELIDRSYSTFTHPDVIPVVKNGNIFISELFHGPTFAFKDVALQFLGNLFEHILKERGEKMNIIGATSGDTGSAAISGVRGKDNINIFIMHPKGRVSPVQEAQMTSVTDSNVYNLAVSGTFDDCQHIVKTIFADLDFKNKYKLGAVNSINWARVLAQIVYYFWSYFRAVESVEDTKCVIVVPTGNFGNIFAGYFASRMGLPVKKLILATNENNILSRFVDDGDYSLRDVVMTHSPSMDIQIASNFERYLYYFYNEDAAKVRELMEKLSKDKKLEFSKEDIAKVNEIITTHSATNNETLDTINIVFEETGYVLDPHTACGVAAGRTEMLRPKIPVICLSTAHPAKFPDAVNKAIGKDPDIPQGIADLEGLEKRVFDMENDVDKVKDFVAKNV
jgi:threonine synthase